MTSNNPEQLQDRPLAEAIAVATRSVHAKLNKLIIARLPLALPPQAADSTLYITGMLHIAPIYITFESLWRDILDAPPADVPTKTHTDDGQTPLLSDQGPQNRSSKVCERTHSILQRLCLPGLLRSDRLRADIRAMTGWPDHIVQEQLKEVSQMGRLSQFLQHIKRSVEKRPHVLLAYSYILFMALFAGGRFIRASLQSVGDDFWAQVPSPVKPTMRACQRPGSVTLEKASGLPVIGEEVSADDYQLNAGHNVPLRFFQFQTPTDGEDLKQEFKRRLVESEVLLTADEKHDILQESVCIFDNMSLLIQQLDIVLKESVEEPKEYGASRKSLGDLLSMPLSRIRDSVAVARERSARSSSKRSSSSSSSSDDYIFLKQDRQAASKCPASNFDHHPLRHPAIPNVGAVERCPAFSKTMRFDSSSTHPSHSQKSAFDTSTDLADSLKMASKRLNTARVANILAMIAFGAIIIGALLTGRGGLMEV